MQLLRFQDALERYRADNGHFPTSGQGLKALIVKPTIEPRPRNWRGPYLVPEREVPPDPYGETYRYMSPGPAGNPFEIQSSGRQSP